MRPIFRVPFMYGLIAGGLGSAIVILLYYLNRHPLLIPFFIDSRIMLFAIFLFFSLKELRDVHLGGILYFWQGVLASFIFLMVFSAIASAVIGLFAGLEPAFVQSYITLKIEEIKSLPADVVEKIGKDVVESNLKSLPSTNGFDLVTMYNGQSFIIGAFISIIISIIIRKTPKP